MLTLLDLIILLIYTYSIIIAFDNTEDKSLQHISVWFCKKK